MDVENKFITTKDDIDGSPSDSDFEVKTVSISLTIEGGSKDVIVKVLYVSIDPYQLNRLKKHSASQKTVGFATQVQPGKEIDALGVGRVVASGNEEFEKDDMVVGLLGWGEYSVVKPGGVLNKLSSMEFPASYHLGVLGISGLTAYAGFFDVCNPKKGETVFVSTALGSVGNLVGQFAKLHGCYVVGCTGSKEKVNMLKEKLGFDDAFNYKEETDLNSALERYFPEGIDIYFDNVGGKMLEAAVANMKPYGRVAVSGVISEYTGEGERAAPNMIDVIYKRITIRGFLAYDHLNIYADFISKTSKHLREGKIHVIEDISEGLETIPSAFAGLFKGDNVGKKIIKIADL